MYIIWFFFLRYLKTELLIFFIDSDTEVDLNEHRKKIEYVTAMKDRRLSVKQSSIYASAMLPRKKGNGLV